MYSIYFVISNIALVFFIVIQLIKMSSFILRMKKNDKLNKEEIKEDKDWEFIKGLY
jgi:hypothetical protein